MCIEAAVWWRDLNNSISGKGAEQIGMLASLHNTIYYNRVTTPDPSSVFYHCCGILDLFLTYSSPRGCAWTRLSLGQGSLPGVSPRFAICNCIHTSICIYPVYSVSVYIYLSTTHQHYLQLVADWVNQKEKLLH